MTIVHQSGHSWCWSVHEVYPENTRMFCVVLLKSAYLLTICATGPQDLTADKHVLPDDGS